MLKLEKIKRITVFLGYCDAPYKDSLGVVLFFIFLQTS